MGEEKLQTKLAQVLGEATTFYDIVGRTPPANPNIERSLIQSVET
jgi:hypothetical protein